MERFISTVGTGPTVSHQSLQQQRSTKTNFQLTGQYEEKDALNVGGYNIFYGFYH